LFDGDGRYYAYRIQGVQDKVEHSKAEIETKSDRLVFALR
jgi:hypothetical protein